MNPASAYVLVESGSRAYVPFRSAALLADDFTVTESPPFASKSFLVSVRSGYFWRPGRLVVLPGVARVQAWRGFAEEFSTGVVRVFTARVFAPWSNVYLRFGTEGQDIQVTVSVPLWMRATLRRALHSAGFTTINRAVWLPWANRNE